ncbi:Transcription factor PDR1 [Nakaseomyces bracarensis]|uniref:Transcription factor PDR1 n=1 Tax=Nakaseomyces bracarensis TaxID=273131 RepID=A0ABR4NPP3_9SACH
MSEFKVKKPKRKVGKACDSCRRRKIKCNGVAPCPSCITYGCECIFSDRKTTKKTSPKNKSPITGNNSAYDDKTNGYNTNDKSYVLPNANVATNSGVTDPIVNTSTSTNISNNIDDNIDNINSIYRQQYEQTYADTESDSNENSEGSTKDPLIIYKDDEKTEETIDKLTNILNELESIVEKDPSIQGTIDAVKKQLNTVIDSWEPDIDFDKLVQEENGCSKSIETNLMKNKYSNHVHLTRFRIWIDYKNANKSNHFMGECGFSLAESFFASNQPLVDELFGLYSQVESFSLQGLGYCVHLFEPYMKTDEAIRLMKETLYIVLRFIDICVHHISEESISIANPLETYLNRKNLMPITHTPRSSYGSPGSSSTRNLVSTVIEHIRQPYVENITKVSNTQLLATRDDDSKMFGLLLNMCKAVRNRFVTLMTNYTTIDIKEDSNGEMTNAVKEFTYLCETEELLLALCYNYYNSTLYSFFEFGTNIEYMEHLVLLLEEQLSLDEHYGFDKVINVAVDNAKKMGFHRWEFYVGYDEATAERRRRLWWTLYWYEKSSIMQKGFISTINDSTVNCLLPKIFRDNNYLDRRHFLENIQKCRKLKDVDVIPVQELCNYGNLALSLIASEFHVNFLYKERYTTIRNTSKPPKVRNVYLKEIIEGIRYCEKSYEAIKSQTSRLWNIVFSDSEDLEISREDRALASKFTLNYEYHRFRLINMADNLIARLTVKPKPRWLVDVLYGHLLQLHEHWKVMNKIILSMTDDYSVAQTFEHYAPLCLYLTTQTFLIIRNMEMDDIRSMVSVYHRFLKIGEFLEQTKVVHLADSHTFRDFSRSFSFITIITRLMIIEYMQSKDITKEQLVESFSKDTPDLSEIPRMILDPNSCLYYSLLQPIKKSGFTLSFKKILEDARMMDLESGKLNNKPCSSVCPSLNNILNNAEGDCYKSPKCTPATGHNTDDSVSSYMSRNKSSLMSGRTASTDSITTPPIGNFKTPLSSTAKNVVNVPNEAFTPVGETVSDVPDGAELNVQVPFLAQPNSEQQSSYNLGTLDEFVNKGDLSDLYNSLWGDLFSDIYL